jgi:hypothetical protein
MIGFRNAELLDSKLHEPIFCSRSCRVTADDTSVGWWPWKKVDVISIVCICMSFTSQQTRSTMMFSPLDQSTSVHLRDSPVRSEFWLHDRRCVRILGSRVLVVDLREFEEGLSPLETLRWRGTEVLIRVLHTHEVFSVSRDRSSLHIADDQSTRTRTRMRFEG